MKRLKITASTLALAISLSLGFSANAQVVGKPVLVASNSPVITPTVPDRSLAAVLPKIPTNNIRLDYEVLDDALGGTVIRFGPSIRRHMSRPDPKIGSRFVRGHTSAYRLEGSRVSFYFFSKEYLEELTAYRKDLERIATQIDIVHMPYNEQLAFWFNLHNVALIEQIAAQYPIKRPGRLKVGGVDLDDAKILNIKNTPLSLRDIREKIVYPNWSSPNVIYGFFRGTIGSPALQNFAYTRDNVTEILSIQATEFVNALRGFNLTSNNRNVSMLYDEARPYYFANWDQDIKAHLLKYARPEVAEEIRRDDRPFRVAKFDTVIADLVGGSRPRIATGNITSPTSGSSNTPLPDEVVRLLRELNNKTEVLRRRKLIGQGRGTVTIQDIETIDVDIPPVRTSE